MFHLLVLISLLTSNAYDVAAVTLDASLLNQLGYDNQSSSVNINGKNITDIDPNAFRGYTNLRSFNLIFNTVTKLDLVVFKDSVNLETLYLEYNQIPQLTNSNKIKFPYLQNFYIYMSELVSLDSNVVNAFPNITSCAIGDQLSPLRPNQISAWKKLKILFITTKNQISLTKTHFNGLNALESFAFVKSNIKTIEVHTLLALPNVTSVDLSNNALTSFEYLQIPSKLETLNLKDNKISYFRLSRTMLNLRYLFLDNNLFRSFKSMDFSFLANLMYLDLSNNPHAYPNEIGSHLNYLVNLNTVYLSNLSISNIDSNFFKKNTNLNSIDLSNNKISAISYDAFINLKNLDIIHLNDNQISVLDYRTFVGVNQLSSLNLQNNKLIKITSRTFYNMRWLSSLYLTNNLISEIDSTAFTGCSGCYNIDLDHNQLTKLSPRTFENLKLGYLDLSFNKITEIDNSTFYGLSVSFLNLYDNNITNIVPGTFNNVTITQSLDLSYNQLTKLDNNTFVGLYELAIINLSYNKISTIVTGAFNGMTKVQSITLDYNNLTQLDNSIFAGLSKLKLISLYGNPNLSKSNLQSLCPSTAMNCIVQF